MSLHQLIYASRPFGFDQAALNGILVQARRCNTRDGITGALICRSDLYLQLLEGPEDAVEAAYARIVRDDRHIEVNRLSSTPVADRLFPNWAMRDDPARSWLWTREEVGAGVVAQVSREALLRVFGRLAAEPDRASA
ncbi:MAG TPA: BLUF domain-containing protein [Methylobacterium sp.]